MRNRLFSVLTIFALTLVCSMESAQAEDPLDRFTADTFTGAHDGKSPAPVLKYQLLRPAGYQAEGEEKYPLVVFMHGAGERGSDNRAQLKHGMREFASDKIMKKHPAFVLAPQVPAGQQWVNVPWSAKQHAMPAQPSTSMKLTHELIAKLQKEYRIDPRRIYVTGLSMGGFGAWDAASRWPELFAACAPICGGGDVAQAAKFKKVPVWAFHGSADNAVKVSRSRDMIAALKSAGAEPRYTEYEGVGHNSWSRAYGTGELYEWMFAQQKPQP